MEGVKPNYLAIGPDGLLWEFISRPYLVDAINRIVVRVPGDPTTIKEVDVADYRPLHLPAPDGESYFADHRNMIDHEIDTYDLKNLYQGEISPP